MLALGCLLLIASPAVGWSEADQWVENGGVPAKAFTAKDHHTDAQAEAIVKGPVEALVEARVKQGGADTGVNNILFIFFSLLVGLFTQVLWSDVPFLRKYVPLPYTVIIFLFGLMWGYMSPEYKVPSTRSSASHFASHPRLLTVSFLTRRPSDCILSDTCAF